MIWPLSGRAQPHPNDPHLFVLLYQLYSYFCNDTDASHVYKERPVGFSNVEHDFFGSPAPLSLFLSRGKRWYISVSQSEAVQVGEMIPLYKYMYK